MSILTRYVLREFLIPLFYCLTGFIAIYVLFELFGSFARIVEADMPFVDCVLYFAGYLSPFFHYLASAAMMLATLYTMWNFCRHSELTAMRASGIGLLTIVKPLLFVGLFMGGLVAWVSESYMPQYAQWAKRMKSEKFDSAKAEYETGFSFRNTSANRTWTVKGGANRDYSRLDDVFVVLDRPDGSRMMSISADKAEYLDGEWWFTAPEVKHYDINTRPQASQAPELDALSLRVFPEFCERPIDIQMQNCDPKLISVRGKLRYIRTNRDLTEASRSSLKYDAWAQIFAPLACIIITLLSIPAGISSGRQSVFSGILGAIGMFFAYHGLSVGCMVLAKTELMPPIPAAVVPPILFLALGVYFFRNSLKATYILLGLFIALFVMYVASAYALEVKCQIGGAMAHSLAATIPVMGAVAALAKFRLKP